LKLEIVMSRSKLVPRTFRQPQVDPKQVTSERIESDLQSFIKAGGSIEVLGVTRVLTKLDETTAAAAPPGAPAKARSGK